MTHSSVRPLVTASALSLAILGTLLLFAPEDASAMLVPGSAGGPFVQLVGASLLGFAVMNWIVRGSALGGIYGKAAVAGNQTHLTIGALVLLKWGVDTGFGQLAYWAFVGLYALGAGLFSYLTFFRPGIPNQ